MSTKPIKSDLEVTFGRIPDSLYENLKYISFNEETNNFTCRPCEKIIKTVVGNEKSTTKNFQQHFESKGHKEFSTPGSIILDKLNNTFNGSVPQVLRNLNFHVIGMNGNDFYCELCDKTIKISVNISTSTHNFSYHLLSSGHEAKLEKYREVLDHVYSIYGGIPRVVLNQIDWLRKISHCAYECTVCKKKLQVHPHDRHQTKKNFTKHLQTTKHIRNAKEAKAFVVVPQLKYIFPTLPNYMLTNIDYISMNQSHFFCSLCNVNIIYNAKDAFETENNFKVHFSLADHEERLRLRMDLNNEVYSRLKTLFESVPESVSDNLKYLSFENNAYCCNVCCEVITEEYDDDDDDDDAELDDADDDGYYNDNEDDDYSDDNADDDGAATVLADLISHCTSSGHEERIQSELEYQLEVVEDLEDLFGSVPKVIKENIMHIEFKGGVNFKCNLCDKTLKSIRLSGHNRDTYSAILDNFEKHLNSNTHKDAVLSLERVDSDLQNELDSLFSPIPQYVMNNFQHLGFKRDSDDDFQCYLCNETIAVASGNKKHELTMQNFRIHILSAGHIAQLKYQANIEAVTLRELEAIFGKVPSVILSGIEHLILKEDSYLCKLCDAHLHRNPKFLLSHFYGKNHRAHSNEHEDKCTEALHQLDRRYWRFPEFLLTNIDFFDPCESPHENELFCILCQTSIVLNEEDLEETVEMLNLHVDSKEHQSLTK